MKKHLHLIIISTIVLLVFSYFSYNIKKVDNNIDYFIKYNYFQGEGLVELLKQKVDVGITDLIREEIENNELSSVISFDKSANRVDFFVNVFGVISVLFLAIIGYLVIDHRKAIERFQDILNGMESKRDQFFEDADKEIDKIRTEKGEIMKMTKEAKRVLRDAKKAKRLIESINYKDSINKLNRIKFGSKK
ncbi:hypothetical protein ACFL05_00795 [Patescibacteria group bacterium]